MQSFEQSKLDHEIFMLIDLQSMCNFRAFYVCEISEIRTWRPVEIKIRLCFIETGYEPLLYGKLSLES
jgi:hypothetical protein